MGMFILKRSHKNTELNKMKTLFIGNGDHLKLILKSQYLMLEKIWSKWKGVGGVSVGVGVGMCVYTHINSPTTLT